MPVISQYSLFGRLQALTKTQPRLEIGRGTMKFLGFPTEGRSLKHKRIIF